MTTANQAIDEYQAARRVYTAEAENVIPIRFAIRGAQSNLEAIEADLMLNGGLGGSNAEQRKAALTLACEEHDGCQKARKILRTLEADLAATEARKEDAANRMRGARLLIEYETSANNREAALLGNREPATAGR